MNQSAITQLDSVTQELRTLQRTTAIVEKAVQRAENGQIVGVVERHVQPDIATLIKRGKAAAEQAMAEPDRLTAALYVDFVEAALPFLAADCRPGWQEHRAAVASAYGLHE